MLFTHYSCCLHLVFVPFVRFGGGDICTAAPTLLQLLHNPAATLLALVLYEAHRRVNRIPVTYRCLSVTPLQSRPARCDHLGHVWSGGRKGLPGCGIRDVSSSFAAE